MLDDVWEAQQKGQDLEQTPFVNMMKQLIQERVGFVCWCANDSEDLPQVSSVA